jgi:hypothetical protein
MEANYEKTGDANVSILLHDVGANYKGDIIQSISFTSICTTKSKAGKYES